MSLGGPRVKLDGLQAGRAVAAIVVVLYHANNFVLPLRLYEGQILWRGFGMGYAGVEFFFLLSGFLMVHIHRRDFGNPARVTSFARKRIVRIYPFYWVVLAGLVIVYQIIGETGPELLRDPSVILRSFLLVPSETRQLLPVAWTLQHEIFFYIVFAMVIVNREVGLVLFGLWMLGCLWQMTRPDPGFPVSFVFSPYNVLFAIGMTVAATQALVPQKWFKPLFFTGLVGFAFVGLSEAYFWPWPLWLRVLAYGASGGAVVMALARGSFSVSKGAVFLGDASYSIYLTHLPAMNAAALILAKTGLTAHTPPGIAFVLLTGLALLAGCVIHLAIERPLLAYFRRPRQVEAIS